MSQATNKVKLNKDASLFYIDHFNNIEGEITMDINNEISITFYFTAEYEAEDRINCNGDHLIELGDIGKIKINTHRAWTLNEEGRLVDQADYKVDNSVIPELKLKKLIKTLYKDAMIELESELNE